MFFNLGSHNIKKINIYLTAGLIFASALTACNPIDSEPNPTVSTSITEENIDNESVDNSSEPGVRFGILAIDSALSVHDRYGPLIDYLSEKVGRPVELVVLNQESQFTQAAEAKLDFIFNNSLAAVQVQRLYKTNLIVTLERPNVGSQFSALIITRRDSEIQELSDLKGKKVACVDFETAAAGCLFQIYHLLKNNIDPFQEFASFVENPSQDSIVLAVLNGTIDAGFIRTGQLERMMKAGLIDDTTEIKVLSPKNDDFFYVHTTDLYPEWPVAALPNTDPELVDAVKDALLSIPADHPALKDANVSRFLPAADYESIHNLVEALKLKSWDAQ